MSPTLYGILADIVAVLHILYAGSIVVGLFLILIGGARGWKWVRQPWLRSIHLGMIAIVVAEAWLGIVCPLTVWEEKLRALAGQPFDGNSVVARTIHYLLFFDAPWWVFTACYTICGTLIFGTLLLVPPNFSRRELADRHTASERSS
ncbi:MAG: DUF2784 domain-containing protein [Planctomycetaceae bacterium]|nr:DUF2784 domain-containing protein [Planctomycetaceae bacterium]